jgi:hypothetical protein
VFTPVGEESLEGRVALKMHFKAVPGSSSPAALQLRGRNYPLPLAGDIWVDRETGAVVKLSAGLDGSFEDLGLRSLHADVEYAPVPFHEPEEAYWMPSIAVIDVETPKQHWRNVHRFSAYRRFRSTTEEVQAGDQKP